MSEKNVIIVVLQMKEKKKILGKQGESHTAYQWEDRGKTDPNSQVTTHCHPVQHWYLLLFFHTTTVNIY